MSNDFFKMRGIVKQYQMGNEVQTILKGIDLDIEEGEFLSILGPSGSGKSTLMNIIGCLDTPTSGEYILHGRMIRDLDEKQLAHIRSKEIGFIFQQFQLLPRLDALKNVELPLIYAGVPPRERTRRAEEMLVRVGLKDRIHHYQNQLSCARAGDQPDAAAGGRTDRRARSGDGRTGDGAFPRAERRGANHRYDYPRPQNRAPREPHRQHSGRRTLRGGERL